MRCATRSPGSATIAPSTRSSTGRWRRAALRRPAVAAAHRPRRVQGGERQRGHAGGDRVLRGFGQLLGAAASPRRPRVSHRRRRVRGPAARTPTSRARASWPAGSSRRRCSPRFGSRTSSRSRSPLASRPSRSWPTARAALYSQADAALYAAKRGGRTDIVAYRPATDDQRRAGRRRARRRRRSPRSSPAASCGPVYQPIVALASRAVIGVEGLIRPEPPAPFADPAALFAAAEAGGRLTRPGPGLHRDHRRGCRASCPADQFLSLNLSPPTHRGSGVQQRRRCSPSSARHGFPPDRLVVELTEQQAHPRHRPRARAARRAAGGPAYGSPPTTSGPATPGCGCSSEISFDVLKVDLGLVQSSAAGGPSSAVLGSVVALASRMGALVVAEGIEHESQLAQLVDLGIDAGQGYHLGRPGPLQDAIPVAGRRSRWRRCPPGASRSGCPRLADRGAQHAHRLDRPAPGRRRVDHRPRIQMMRGSRRNQVS